MKRLSLKIVLVTLALLAVCATVVMFFVPVSAQGAWLWPTMMVGCCFVSVAICFFAAVIAKMKKSGQHLSLVNMYRYALLLLTSGFESIVAFMRSSKRWSARGAFILAAITICAISIGVIAVFFGLANAFLTGIVVLAVLCVVAIGGSIARAMKDGFTFNSLILGYETGFGSGHDDLGSTNSRGTGSGSGHVDPGRGHKTNARMGGFFHFTLVHDGKIQIPTSGHTTKLNATVTDNTAATSSSSVSAGAVDVSAKKGA